MKKLLILSLLGLFACHEPDCEQLADQSTGLVEKVLPHDYSAYSQDIGDLGRYGIEISTDEMYRRVFANCCKSQLDSIDFDKFDMLGLTTVNRGASSSYVLDVQQDDVAKKITYTITERYCKRASPIDGRGNFVLVPKLPNGYKIAYMRNQ